MADVYFDAAGGQNAVQRRDGSGEYDYTALEIDLGVRFPLPWDAFLLVEGGHNRLWGDEKVLGSYRNLGFARVGYRQTVLKYLFAAVKAGLGYNDSHINFGEGVIPLPDEKGMPLLISGQLGLQATFAERLSAQLFAQPFYERNLAGGPDYDTRGVVFGAGFAFDLSKTIPASRLRAVEEERDRWRGTAREMEDKRDQWRQAAGQAEQERDRLRGERDRLAREGGTLAKAGRCPTEPPLACPDAIHLLADDPLGATVIFFPNEDVAVPRGENRVRQIPTDRIHPQLELVAQALKDHPGLGVIVHGHANETGDEADNEYLSRRRAEVVANYLVSRGVKKGQVVELVAHGSKDPPYPQDRASGLNRAVRFQRVDLP